MLSCTYSNLAYNDKYAIRERLKKLHLKNIDLVKDYDGRAICKRDAQAFLFRSGKKMVFAFRGTMNKDDIMDAIDIRKSVFEATGSKIHHGFYQQFTSLEPMITNDVYRAMDSKAVQEIHFVGHSMGGAVAAIAASYYALKKKHLSKAKITCHTFGNPHFADETLSNTIQEEVDEHICVHVRDDIIPFIPIYPDFKHLPNILEIDADGNPSCMIDFDLSYAHFVRKVFNAGNVTMIYKNHSCISYYNLLFTLYKHLERHEKLYRTKVS
jgi:hypothetical protein